LSEDVDAVVIGTAIRMGSPTLPELVHRLVSENGMKPKAASKAVYILWKKGRLELLESNPPSTVLSYALNSRSIWFWFVTALVVLTMPLILLASVPPLIYLRYVLGAIFVLYLPGSMLIEALYAKARDLDGLERGALSIGLSLAVVPLIGLVLNFTPWGIRLEPIMVSLALFTEIMAAASLVRKFRYYHLGIEGIRRA
jgi:hypothetical protein